MSRQNTKDSHIKTVLIPALILLFAALLLLLLNGMITQHRLTKNQRNADYELAGLIAAHYPDITSEELISLINLRDSKKAKDISHAEAGRLLLETYGYNEGYRAAVQGRILRQSQIACAIILALILLSLAAVYALKLRRQAEEIDGITGYIRKLNDRQYDLFPADNSEEGLSLLKNEIYKTTVMLKEIAEKKTEESKRLSKSLEDISHQLRTPLASMTIMIDNICDDPGMPPEVRNDFLKDISGQVTWISELVDSLLTLAKFDAGTVVMKQEPLDAVKLLKDSVKRLAILLDVRDVHVVYDGISEDAPMVFTGDYKWQLEAVTNIIKNCAEHSPAGSKLTLSAEQNSLYTKLSVRDEGEGISREDLRHIFERFYKAKNARPESIGIGLSLAESIVEAGGGFINVESEEGRGSLFEIKYIHS